MVRGDAMMTFEAEWFLFLPNAFVMTQLSRGAPPAINTFSAITM
jgi:hypothetical protein